VFLKVSPMRGVTRFRKKGKLSPRFVGPFKITHKVERLAYRIALPPDLVGTHDVFYVSMLRKYIATPKEQVLRIKTIPIVKVLWYNHGVEEAS
jgi:hypothetical protein